MAEYIASYAFELREPINNQRGGYGELRISTDKPVDSEEDWREIARQCFQKGEGTYSKVMVTHLGVLDTTPDTDESTVSGEIIE